MAQIDETRPRRGRPRGSTRERILDIALELFNEQGYDKTSLREIADRLGTTKAALYHHFQRKQDILLELHLRLHALGHGVLDRLQALGDGQQRADAWPGLLDEFIDQVISSPELFLLHQRNRNAFEQLEYDERHAAENDDIIEQIQALLASPDIPLAERVRIACSIGAVVGGLLGAGDVYGDVPMTEVAALVRSTVRDLFGPRAGA